MAILLLAEAKLQLNKTTNADDVELQSYVDATCALVEDVWGPVATTTVTEHHNDATGAPSITLTQRPVASFTSVTEFYSAAGLVLTVVTSRSSAAANCVLHEADTGTLRRLSSGGVAIPFLGPVEIVYTAGFASVPAEVNMAARIIVANLWETQNGGPPGDDLVPVPGTMHLIPYRARALLDGWRRERTRYVPGIG